MGSSGWSAGKQATPIPPTVIPITPTVVHTTGSGELLVQADSVVGTAEGGIILAENDGTIPFTIHFNQKSGLFEIQGEARGSGKNTYEHPECKATATFWVDYVVAGVLVPKEGLAADKGNGCYMVIKVHQEWQDVIGIAATCKNISIKGLVASPVGTKNTTGPYKVPVLGGTIYNGAGGGEIIRNDTWQTEYKITVQKLDLPQESGCFAGETIIKPNK
jgi:hypothetical protein